MCGLICAFLVSCLCRGMSDAVISADNQRMKQIFEVVCSGWITVTETRRDEGNTATVNDEVSR